MSNQAAWLDGKAQPFRVADAPMPKAKPDHIVIKNHALAINPVDWKIQDYGVFIQKCVFPVLRREGQANSGVSTGGPSSSAATWPARSQKSASTSKGSRSATGFARKFHRILSAERVRMLTGEFADI